MKTGIATTVSVVGVIAAGVAAFAVNSSVLSSSGATNSAVVSTTVTAVTPNVAMPTNDKVGATEAQATEVTDTTTTYQVGAAGTVVIDTSSGSIVVTAIAPAAGFTSEPARTEVGGLVKVHFVSSAQRIEFTAQLVDGVVKTNVVNESTKAPSAAPRPDHDDDDDGDGEHHDGLERHDGDDD